MSRELFHIIIADDDAAILESLSMMLELEGYQVDTVLNGKGVLNKFPKPDLYILDIWMSGIDGRELCRTIKSDPLTKDIPVILFSASNELKVPAENCGADKFLPKPFEMSDLMDVLENLVSLKSTRKLSDV